MGADIFVALRLKLAKEVDHVALAQLSLDMMERHVDGIGAERESTVEKVNQVVDLVR